MVESFFKAMQLWYVRRYPDYIHSIVYASLHTATFDMQSILVVSTDNGRVCLTVSHVTGHETPAWSFIKLVCSTVGCNTQINFTFTGPHACIESVPPNDYTLFGTDLDAVDNIDLMPAVTVMGVKVSTCHHSTKQFLSLQTTTPTESEANQIWIYFSNYYCYNYILRPCSRCAILGCKHCWISVAGNDFGAIGLCVNTSVQVPQALMWQKW